MAFPRQSIANSTSTGPGLLHFASSVPGFHSAHTRDRASLGPHMAQQPLLDQIRSYEKRVGRGQTHSSMSSAQPTSDLATRAPVASQIEASTGMTTRDDPSSSTLGRLKAFEDGELIKQKAHEADLARKAAIHILELEAELKRKEAIQKLDFEHEQRMLELRQKYIVSTESTCTQRAAIKSEDDNSSGQAA